MSLFNISYGEMRMIVFICKYMKIYIYHHLLSSPSPLPSSLCTLPGKPLKKWWLEYVYRFRSGRRESLSNCRMKLILKFCPWQRADFMDRLSSTTLLPIVRGNIYSSFFTFSQSIENFHFTIQEGKASSQPMPFQKRSDSSQQ